MHCDGRNRHLLLHNCSCSVEIYICIHNLIMSGSHLSFFAASSCCGQNSNHDPSTLFFTIVPISLFIDLSLISLPSNTFSNFSLMSCGSVLISHAGYSTTGLSMKHTWCGINSCIATTIISRKVTS